MDWEGGTVRWVYWLPSAWNLTQRHGGTEVFAEDIKSEIQYLKFEIIRCHFINVCYASYMMITSPFVIESCK